MGADGDTDVFLEVVFIHGADDDSLFEAFVEGGPAVAYVDEDEVGLGGDIISKLIILNWQMDSVMPMLSKYVMHCYENLMKATLERFI